MASIIIYLADTEYIEQTLIEIVDKTPPYLLEEIIVCNDTGHEYTNEAVEILNSDHIGRAKCWNKAAEQAISTELVFLQDTIKLSKDWLQPLIARVKDSKTLVSPIIHTLNTQFWISENKSWKRFGWRWDMSLYSRRGFNANTPAISSNCIVTTSDWFNYLGGFDEGMTESGEDIELSIRSWLFGGSVEVEDDSYISVRYQDRVKNVNNLSRIISMWMPDKLSMFCTANNVDQLEISPGNLRNLMELKNKQIYDVEWFIDSYQPELGRIYDLQGSANNLSVAVVGYGPSIDYIDLPSLYKHDIIISVDYMGLFIESDYVVADSSHVVTELKSKYEESQFVLPFFLSDMASGKFIPSGKITPECFQYELSNVPGVVVSDSPPFCNFEQSLHSAINFALFLKPRTVSLFGCDNRIIDGKSHTSKISFYEDGELWTDSDATRRKFQYFVYGITSLGKLALMNNIPLLRVSHA